MKKVVATFLTALLVASMLTVCAGARASDQIDSGWAVAQSAPKGRISVEFQVTGTGMMSKLGANLITLYEKDANRWRPVETLTSSDCPELFTTNSRSYNEVVTFDGVSGKQYYAEVSVFASDSSGTDYKTYTSNTVTAK